MAQYVSTVAYNELEDAKKILNNLSTKYETASITKKKYNDNCAKLKDGSGDSIRQSIINGANNNVNAYSIFEYQLRSNIKVKAKLNIFEENKLILSAWLKDKVYMVKGYKYSIPTFSGLAKQFNIDNLKIDKGKSKQIYNCLVNKHLKAKKYKHNFKKIYLKIQQLAEELKIEADNLEAIISTYKGLDKTQDNVGESQTEISKALGNPVGKKLTVAELRKKIKQALKEGKIKKANKLYNKLKNKVSKEKAKEIAKKLIEKTGATVKLKKGEFVLKPEKTSNAVEETAAVITNEAVPLTIDFVSYAKKRDAADIEAKRKNEKANLYDEIAEKIDAIDPNAENAKELLEQYQEEKRQKELEIDLYYDEEIEKLESKDYSSDYYSEMTQEEINNDLSHSIESEQANYNEKVKSGGAYSYNIDKKATEINNAVALKEAQNNSSSEAVASPAPTESQTTTIEAKLPTQQTQSSNKNASANTNTNNNFVTNDGPREDLPNPETKNEETPDINNNLNSSSETPSDNKVETPKQEEVISIPEEETPTKSTNKKSGLGTAIPVGLGVAAVGAAAVAGARYIKNRKLNEDVDDSYDDENNNLEYTEDGYEEIPSDSAYMQDDYLAPEGSEYTEIPDENQYTDAEELEEAAGVNSFSEDAALNDLS